MEEPSIKSVNSKAIKYLLSVLWSRQHLGTSTLCGVKRRDCRRGQRSMTACQIQTLWIEVSPQAEERMCPIVQSILPFPNHQKSCKFYGIPILSFSWSLLSHLENKMDCKRVLWSFLVMPNERIHHLTKGQCSRNIYGWREEKDYHRNTCSFPSLLPG